MADLEFNRREIEDLARKLSTLESSLTVQERALLLAIFAAAADRANQTGPGVAALPQASGTDEEATLADLQQQLLSAHTPGNSFNDVTQDSMPPSIHH